MALFHVSTPSGERRLGSTRDGSLVLAPPGTLGVMPLVATPAGSDRGSWFLRPVIPDVRLLLEPGDEAQHMLLLHAEEAPADAVVLLLPARTHALASDGSGRIALVPVTSAAATPDGTPFRLVPADPAGRIAASLTPPPTQDRQGLGALLAASDPAMVQCTRGLMETMAVGDIRTVWAEAGDFAFHDGLFPVMVRRNVELLGRFRAYTRDLLAADAARFGWSIGERSYGSPKILEAGRGILTIGRYCALANPDIILGNHRTDVATTYPFIDLWAEWPGARAGLADHRSADVVIGNDVWIGVGCILLPGTVIGDGTVIAAGSVVRGRIPPYVICGGNPAVVRRPRIAPPLAERMLRIRWWDWPAEKVSRYIPLLLDPEIERFLKAAEAEAEAGAEAGAVTASGGFGEGAAAVA